MIQGQDATTTNQTKGHHSSNKPTTNLLQGQAKNSRGNFLMGSFESLFSPEFMVKWSLQMRLHPHTPWNKTLPSSEWTVCIENSGQNLICPVFHHYCVCWKWVPALVGADLISLITLHREPHRNLPARAVTFINSHDMQKLWVPGMRYRAAPSWKLWVYSPTVKHQAMSARPPFRPSRGIPPICLSAPVYTGASPSILRRHSQQNKK